MDRPAKPLEQWSPAELIAEIKRLESLLPEDPLSAQEQRDAQIVTKKWRGASDEDLAAEFGVHPKTVRNVVARWRSSHGGLRLRAAEDPSAVVDELVEQYQATASWFAEIAGKAGDNYAAAVGALRGRMDALQKVAELLQASGALPHDLGKLRLEIDVKYVAEVLVAVLERHSVPLEAQAEILETLSESTGLALAKGE